MYQVQDLEMDVVTRPRDESTTQSLIFVKVTSLLLAHYMLTPRRKKVSLRWKGDLAIAIIGNC